MSSKEIGTPVDKLLFNRPGKDLAHLSYSAVDENRMGSKQLDMPVLKSQVISSDTSKSNDTQAMPAASFFNKEKHQHNYYLLDCGKLYIETHPFQQQFQIFPSPLHYQIVLMANKSSATTEKPENFFMILGNIKIILPKIINE